MRSDKGEGSILVLLDLTAAFDTIVHSILVEWLISGLVSRALLSIGSHPISQSTGSLRLS